ncbi:hypothetical protein K443DRAFT_91594 [Laccaria amethystina LaAM-08-1]|uniref:Uncharacterized protein n=1 Tax=Laccaria amethystina LaAM-08-1 TaxID=1095629 RepID=A0A0C9Y521_9AGAR|nr:hypothetical protein K443DRAFT_91594 [Laccaria amethystina LaAM-08-1]
MSVWPHASGAKHGHVCYAKGQADIWMRLADDANKKISVANLHYQIIPLV